MSTGRKYPGVQNGQWLQPRRKDYRIQCCDCGLVHSINFRIKRGRIQLQPSRQRRSTAAVRRAHRFHRLRLP